MTLPAQTKIHVQKMGISQIALIQSCCQENSSLAGVTAANAQIIIFV